METNQKKAQTMNQTENKISVNVKEEALIVFRAIRKAHVEADDHDRAKLALERLVAIIEQKVIPIEKAMQEKDRTETQ